MSDDRHYRLLRDDENWSWLRHDHGDSDFWDPVKYLRLGERDDVFLTLGGETRQWVEGYRNELWGQTGVEDNVYWLQRYMLHADTHLTPYARVFVQLKSGIEDGRQGGPRPVDEDLLDFNQLYADTIAIPGATLDDEPKLLLRTGLQEMSYGSGRLIDVREGPNVRFGYDGVRLISRPLPFRIDAFAVRPQVTQKNPFGDGPNLHEGFWGVYATYDVPHFVTDLYYLGLEREGAKYQKVAGTEWRQTIGARARGRFGAADLEVEGAYQFGSIASLPIAAWTVAAEGVMRGSNLPLRPVATLGLGATSGDGGASNRALGTFNPLFPRGAYFGLVSANGPSNNVAPHAQLAATFPAGFSGSIEAWAFWRQSPSDGVYNVPGMILRTGAPSQGSYLGTQVEGFVTLQANRHLSFNATLAYFAVGTFFRTSPPGKDITYGAGWATYKF
ncbi:MAG TPA: alginate export family protein [Polyangiaceae bacterium]|nr:alginate export family protein [Polyangiaceae bacterium]